MTLYVSLIPGSTVLEVERYGAGGPAKEESIEQAPFLDRAGQAVQCTDSFVNHGFTFAPSFSFMVECESEMQGRIALGGAHRGADRR